MISIDLAANVIGMVGTTIVVGTYMMLQMGKISNESLSFNVLNLVGAIFLLLSLLVHFNLASMVIEVFWILASLIGLWRYLKSRTDKTPSHTPSKTSK